MTVGSGGAERGLYQPGVVPVLHGAIQILGMCPSGTALLVMDDENSIILPG